MRQRGTRAERFRGLRRASLGLFAGALSMPLLACGEPSAASWPAGRPRIDELTFDQQRAGDPLALDFGVVFGDSDGDLQPGVLELRVDDRQRSVLGLADVFAAQVPPISADATGGRFTVVVRLDEGEVQAGSEIRFTFVLEDASGQRSNEPWIDLRVLSDGGT